MGFTLEFCTGAGAGMSRGSPAGFPAGSGLKFRKSSGISGNGTANCEAPAVAG